MREAHDIERAVGVEYYVSDAEGVGGRLRETPGDFQVRELEAFDAEPVDADPGAFPHLVVRVTLRDWDTNGFAGALSDRLGISRERVSWAGTKDKRAVTTQLFSIDGVEPSALPDIRDVDVEVVGRAGRPILFGDLAGNAFEITVRDPSAPGSVTEVTADLQAFADNEREADSAPAIDGPATVAVPNYFGQQRFGSHRPVTHEVGLAVVRGDWRGAVRAYVGNPHDREPERTREARTFVDEEMGSGAPDWGAALERYPSHLGYERSMLHRLTEEPGDFRRALEAVPTNLQQLFVNAAQSYVFNRILSERLARGLPFVEPVACDVVCFADTDSPGRLTLPDTDRTQRVTESRVRAVRRHCERGRAFVTAPLVGTDTSLADDEPGDIERAILEDVGVEPGDFDLPGEFHSAGTRRAIAVRTDVAVSRDPLVFEFDLPRGSYATALLREYLKRDPGKL
ncbi:MAG: tRNA pseudouridine(13) synthase TruD [Haloarculaceae archaeon]